MLKPDPQPREVPINLLRPDAESEAARNSLSASLSSLRHQLESDLPPVSVLLSAHAHVGLHPEVFICNVAEFDAALKSAARAQTDDERIQAFSRTIEMYSGPVSMMIDSMECRDRFDDQRRQRSCVGRGENQKMKAEHGQGGNLTLLRARALASAGRIAWIQADFAEARVHLKESLDLFQRAGDVQGTLEALSGLILVMTRQGEFAPALALVEEAQSLLEGVSDRRPLLPILAGLGRAIAFTVMEEALPIGRALSAEAAHIARESGDKRSLSWALDGLAICDFYGGSDTVITRAEVEEALPLFEELGDLWGMSMQKWLLGNVERREGNWEGARRRGHESLTVQSRDNSRQGLSYMLDSAGYLAVEEGQIQRALLLLGAAQALREAIGNVLQPLYALDHENYISRSRGLILPAQWDVWWNRGRALTPEAAIDLALETPGTGVNSGDGK